MPLKKGSSTETRDENIEEMIKAGHKPDQACAAAYREQEESLEGEGKMAPKRKKKEESKDKDGDCPK
jgi:ribosomal protein L12E/L44/L45/RPP1/RPP2